MKAFHSILLLYLACPLLPLAGQDETQPLSPVLDIVTVDPYTGNTILSWLPGGSTDVSSYVIYTYSNNVAMAVDTLKSPYATGYTYTGSAVRYKSEAYVVAAIDSAKNISPLSNSLGTIFLSLVNDTCNGKIQLSWTPYSNPAHPATGYRIYLRLNSEEVVLHQTVPVTTLSWDMMGYFPGSEYCFFVVATVNETELSSSNLQCVESGHESPPEWIETYAVSVEDRKFIITAGYDTGSDIDSFEAQRLTGQPASWQTILPAPGYGGSVVFNITEPDTTSVNLFRVSALNNCGTAVISSSPVRNIVLSSVIEGTDIDLRWNNPFYPDNAIFALWRSTGSDFEEIASGVTDTLWRDDYRTFYAQVTAGAVSYYVKAIRYNAPAGIAVCRSSITSVKARENVFIATAFTPDEDGLNDTFAPIFSFIPTSYEFKVYSRAGVLLFRTTNPGTPWDGRHNGTPMPAGAYLWNLVIVTPSGQLVRRNGTVAILP